MKFFLPYSNDEDAEKNYQAIRKFAVEQTGWHIGEDRIYSADYLHNGEYYTATVGQPEPLTGGPVLAIFASNSYLICTPQRGGVRGEPILIGQPDNVTKFDP